MAPSTPGSSTPATVTVCGDCQAAAVKVSDPGAAVPSVASLESIEMVTSLVGWLVSLTVKVAVPPASVVVSPLIGVTVKPTTSLSVLLTETSAASRPP